MRSGNGATFRGINCCGVETCQTLLRESSFSVCRIFDSHSNRFYMWMLRDLSP